MNSNRSRVESHLRTQMDDAEKDLLSENDGGDHSMKPIIVRGSQPVDWELRSILTLYSGYIETIDRSTEEIDTAVDKKFTPIEPSKIPKLFALIDDIVPSDTVAEYILAKQKVSEYLIDIWELKKVIDVLKKLEIFAHTIGT